VGVGLVAGIVAFGHLWDRALLRLGLTVVVFPGGHGEISQAAR